MSFLTPLVIGAFAAGVAVDRFGVPAVLKAIVTLWNDAKTEVAVLTAAKVAPAPAPAVVVVEPAAPAAK